MSDLPGVTNSTMHDSGADGVIALMTAAVEANESDPCRTGFLVELPGEGEILVTGDLHGNCGNLRRITDLANLTRHRQRRLVLQELVHDLDAENEACRSYRLVELAARFKVTFPDQVHILMGNHEFSELLQLEIGKRGRELIAAFDEGVRAAYGPRTAEVKEAYARFWRSCPLAIRTANRLFISHSTPRLDKLEGLSLDYLRRADAEEVFRRNGPVFSMLWGRDYSPEAAEAFAVRMDADILLVGHTACQHGAHAPNARHVILDCKDLCGCYVLLPLDQPLTLRDISERLRRLYRP